MENKQEQNYSSEFQSDFRHSDTIEIQENPWKMQSEVGDILKAVPEHKRAEVVKTGLKIGGIIALVGLGIKGICSL